MAPVGCGCRDRTGGPAVASSTIGTAVGPCGGPPGVGAGYRPDACGEGRWPLELRRAPRPAGTRAVGAPRWRRGGYGGRGATVGALLLPASGDGARPRPEAPRPAVHRGARAGG